MTNSDVFSGSLNDSKTNDSLSAEDLGITESEYEQLVNESIDCGTSEGHIRAPNGRMVYAPLV